MDNLSDVDLVSLTGAPSTYIFKNYILSDHFAMYRNVKSCYTPEINIILYVNYASI